MSEFHPCSRFAGDPTPCDGNDETASNCQCFQRAEGERAATERIVKRALQIAENNPSWAAVLTGFVANIEEHTDD
jgi:hypothetical protein